MFTARYGQFSFRLSRVNVAFINVHYNSTEISDYGDRNELVKASRLKVVQSAHRVFAASYIENPVYIATTMMTLSTSHNLSIG